MAQAGACATAGPLPIASQLSLPTDHACDALRSGHGVPILLDVPRISLRLRCVSWRLLLGSILGMTRIRGRHIGWGGGQLQRGQRGDSCSDLRVSTTVIVGRMTAIRIQKRAINTIHRSVGGGNMTPLSLGTLVAALDFRLPHFPVFPFRRATFIANIDCLVILTLSQTNDTRVSLELSMQPGQQGFPSQGIRTRFNCCVPGCPMFNPSPHCAIRWSNAHCAVMGRLLYYFYHTTTPSNLTRE